MLLRATTGQLTQTQHHEGIGLTTPAFEPPRHEVDTASSGVYLHAFLTFTMDRGKLSAWRFLK
jgi:hypothetical protein